MYPRVHKRHSRVVGLLHYLYGPGKTAEAHTDPHIVASFDDFTPDPGRDPTVTPGRLARILDVPVKQAGDRAPNRHVWHLSIRAAPEDRHLTDDEWAHIARRVLAATGIDPHGDQNGCRWVAVRHADDHIHIAATLVNADLTPVHPYRDGTKAQTECRRIEKELGLRRIAPGDGTAAKPATAPEVHKAQRAQRTTTPRDELRTRVRTAIAYAADPPTFLRALRDLGVDVHTREGPSGDTLGYKVALPGDTNASGEQIWFAGRTLAPDLSWPRILERLTTPTRRAEAPAGRPDLAATDPWDRTAAHLDQLAPFLQETDGTGTSGSRVPDPVVAGHIAAVGHLLDALPPATAPIAGTDRRALAAAAKAYERASRSRIKAAHRQADALRSTVRELAHHATGTGDGALADIVASSILVVVAISRWYAARDLGQQARAAARTAEHLRAAYRTIAPPALARLTPDSPSPDTTARYADHARTVLGPRADTITTDPAWPALTAALHHAAGQGHPPLQLLHQAVAQRELDTADNPTEVLTWRIQRLARQIPYNPRTAAARTRTSRHTRPATTTPPALTRATARDTTHHSR
ncbi:hypothetical protein B4N89_21700 [Embleya scabrispora]|uniref:MobA/VirD2-like nuclease domain-containing protein n=1 Tax=Embleya scabrispora TaxID=159449 RepID=A0A1T3P2G3_9ACTN|nr:relaxase/mobilization nuclease domain-containing protein [Embleya scabrispora]OPC83204.1 hypothetical protein B4N89_21700 [Embleya scabrispora]